MQPGEDCTPSLVWQGCMKGHCMQLYTELQNISNTNQMFLTVASEINQQTPGTLVYWGRTTAFLMAKDYTDTARAQRALPSGETYTTNLCI